MGIEILYEDTRWREAGLGALASRATTAALAHLGYDPQGFQIALLACDDARIAGLNGAFRDRPGATNVLSWPSEARAAAVAGGDPDPPDTPELGDIALAFETCAREAAEQGKDFETHILHLVVHGTLHLLGYDHIDDADAAHMEALEVAILDRLGVADPYSQ